MNTQVDYMYRDASNYKRGRTEVLAGELSAVEIAEILARREDSEFFIPAQVGLEELQHELWDEYDSGYPTTDDHVWHELQGEDIQLTEAAPTMKHLTAAEWLAQWRAVKEWDVAGAMERLGIEG